jgi:hypothetical protein
LGVEMGVVVLLAGEGRYSTFASRQKPCWPASTDSIDF